MYSKKYPHYVMEDKIMKYINGDHVIINIFFILLNTYLINLLTLDEIYSVNKIEINTDSNIDSYKNWYTEKYNMDGKNITKNNNNDINNNFDLTYVYMMNNIQIVDWNMRANNIIVRLNQINNQNIAMFINNNYDALINQAELLIINDPNINHDLTQQLENEIQKIRLKLLIAQTFKLMIKSAVMFGCFYYLTNNINNFLFRFENIAKAARDFRNIGDRIVERNFSNLQENRTLIAFLGLFSLNNLYRIIRRMLWFKRGGK